MPTRIKLFTFIFCLWKKICFTWTNCLGKCNLYYYISSNVLFSVAGYLKRCNESPTSIQICIGLVDVLLWLKILGNRIGLLTSVLIAMDYFFRSHKSTFNLENKKCICQENLFVYHVSGFTYSRIIFRDKCISGAHTKLWKELEKLICFRVPSFTKSLNS